MPTLEDAIRIAVDDGHISGTMVSPRTRLPGVLFVHGWGGSQEQYLARAREIAALGCVCLTFDLRGHGNTRPQYETVSRESNLRDVLAAYDVLASHRFVDPSTIAVVGSSYGGYLAAILTTMRSVKWLALRVPALYMDNGWELPKRQLHRDQDLGTYRSSLVPAAENRALRACMAFKGDVLVIESEFDKTIPHAVISSYLDACIHAHSLTYRVIKGADHGLTDESSQRAYTSLLVNWMTEMVFGEREGNTPTQSTTMPGSALPEAPPGPA
ncbi:alpha/beta hydrolase family protein [Noviherbaspirillum sp.]|uniref:alpha/beta hydrolase family protein n=1 Tax=Noviherbaspirillum sp. TaxID=1926288 RepID=UPI002B46E27A|nr:alpha/beta fold hydrolase [Noviherbaspirillum sp.]HJV81505.1 alpha/beta fold hydrolase [Noviherbaspirillum sp.]